MRNVRRIVMEINEEIMDHNNDLPLLVYSQAGYVDAVSLSWDGHVLWNSEDNEMEFDEEANTEEPLDQYLKRMLAKYIRELTTIVKLIDIREENKNE